VAEISAESISYHRWDNMEGPAYSIPKTDVLFIRYQNGSKETFRTTARGASSSKIRFQGNIDIGTIFTGECAGPTVDISLGARFGRHFYAGIETGMRSIIESVEYYDLYNQYKKKLFEGYVPLGVNMKGYIPLGQKVNIYASCSLGGFFGIGDISGLNGFTCQVGAGIEAGRISLGLGYNALVKYGTLNMGYIKLGIRLGRN